MKKKMNAKVPSWVVVTVAVVLGLGLEYLVMAGLVWLVCLGFGLEFNWLLPLGVWAVVTLLGMAVSRNASGA